MAQIHIGAEPSKDWLGFQHPESGKTCIENDATAITGWRRKLDAKALISGEATSGGDGRLMRIASAAGRAVHRINAPHGRHFSQWLNSPEINAFDAEMLTRSGQELQLAASLPSDPVRADLAELTE